MSEQKFILSSSGLKNIVIGFGGKEEDGFRFINGDQEMNIPRIFAEFLSPRVSHLHQIDPTIDHLDFNELIKKSKIKTTIFSNVLDEKMTTTIKQLTRGEKIEIDASNEEELRKLSVLLGNEELFKRTNQTNSKEKTTEERLEEVLVYFEISGGLFSIERSKMIDEIASKLTSNDGEKLKRLPRKVLYSIIKSDRFKASDEDLLFGIINEIVSEGQYEDNRDEISDSEMYEVIDFKKLSEKSFREFLSNFDFTQMTGTMWAKLCECFFIKFKPSKNENELEFEYDGNTSHRFSGIVNHLRGDRKINVSDEGMISVTASSTEQAKYPKYAVDFDSDQFFHSDGSLDWLQYDFKEMKIRPTHYSIKTPINHDEKQCPVNWCIEVSNTADQNDWRTIDSRQNEMSVSKLDQSNTFEIQTRLSHEESYRYIRLRATGKTSGNCGNIIIYSLEYFGTLIKKT